MNPRHNLEDAVHSRGSLAFHRSNSLFKNEMTDFQTHRRFPRRPQLPCPSQLIHRTLDNPLTHPRCSTDLTVLQQQPRPRKMASAGAKTEYELERDRRIAENKRKMEVCGVSRGRQRYTQLTTTQAT